MPKTPKTSALLAALTVSAAALVGCTSGEDPDAAAQSHVERLETDADTMKQSETLEVLEEASAAEETAPADYDSGQEWADQKVAKWFDVEGAQNFGEFYAPFNFVESWEQGDAGEVILSVDPQITDGDTVYHQDLGPANDLWLIAAVMLEQTEKESPDLQAVTAVTTDGERSETFTREYMEDVREYESAPAPGDAPGSWADQQLDMFLETAGANSLRAWPEGSAERNIIKSDSPETGVVRFSVRDGDYRDFALEGLAQDYMLRVGCAAEDVEGIIVETENGADSVSRYQCG